jgi:hypothetical protein
VADKAISRAPMTTKTFSRTMTMRFLLPSSHVLRHSILNQPSVNRNLNDVRLQALFAPQVCTLTSKGTRGKDRFILEKIP